MPPNTQTEYHYLLKDIERYIHAAGRATEKCRTLRLPFSSARINDVNRLSDHLHNANHTLQRLKHDDCAHTEPLP